MGDDADEPQPDGQSRSTNDRGWFVDAISAFGELIAWAVYGLARVVTWIVVCILSSCS